MDQRAVQKNKYAKTNRKEKIHKIKKNIEKNTIKNLKRKSEADYQMIEVIYLTWLFPLFLHYYQPPT